MLKFLRNTRLFFEGVVKIIFVSKFRNYHKLVEPKLNTAIILGNGPSLNIELAKPEFLKRLNSVDVVVVNFFNQSDFFEKIRPSYYVLAAPEFWIKDVAQLYIDLRTQLYLDFQTKVTWSMTLFIPFQAKKEKFWQEVVAKNPKITVVFYNIVAFEGSRSFMNFVMRKKLGQPRLHNIIGPSILNLIWLNYSKIYLTGVEHSWLPLIHVTQNNEAVLGQPHFYDNNTTPEQMNGPTGKRKLHEILHKFYVTFRGYFEIKNYADSIGVEIINLTENSFIDAFPKQNVGIFISDSKSNSGSKKS